MWRTTPASASSASTALSPGGMVRRSSLPPLRSQLDARPERVSVSVGRLARGPVMTARSSLQAGQLDALHEPLLEDEEQDQRGQRGARRGGHDQVELARVVAGELLDAELHHPELL